MCKGPCTRKVEGRGAELENAHCTCSNTTVSVIRRRHNISNEGF